MKKQSGITALFYRNNLIANLLYNDTNATIFSTDRQPLAEENSETGSADLLSTDTKNSVLKTSKTKNVSVQYSPYGYTPCPPSVLGYNGESVQSITLHYLLGTGYRTYNPQLMRFLSPDSESPFKRGGINSYAYCSNDPINFSDPSGHMRNPLRSAAAQTLTKSRFVKEGRLYRTVTTGNTNKAVPAPSFSSSEAIHLNNFIKEQKVEITKTTTAIADLKLNYGPGISELNRVEGIINKGNDSLKYYNETLSWTKDRRDVQNTISTIEGRIEEARKQLAPLQKNFSGLARQLSDLERHNKQLRGDLEHTNSLLQASSLR